MTVFPALRLRRTRVAAWSRALVAETMLTPSDLIWPLFVTGGTAVDEPVAALPAYSVPGDLGTKGGLVTDERGRALRPDGSPIPGLYAAGNASAAVMGHTYAGPGATIGPAMTFGYLAALDLAGAPRPPEV